MKVALISSVIVSVLLLLQLVYVWRKYKISSKRGKRALADKNELVDFINCYSASIGYSHNSEDWMNQVAGFIESAMEAKAVWVHRLDGDGCAKLVAFSGRCPVIEPNTPQQAKSLLRTLSEDSVNPAEESGLISQVLGPRSTLKEDFCAHYGAGPIRSLVSVPMMMDGERIGAISVINRVDADELFTMEDMFLLESLSTQVALGLTFVQVYDELNQKQRIEQELFLAQSIQRSLLPDDPPDFDAFTIHADCRAAREVSGDYFDFITLPDNLFLAVIADATGKGVPACMLAAMCRSIVRTNAERYREDLEGLMKEVNKKLFEDTDYAQFITLACLLVDGNDNTVEYARAGHTSLLIRSPDKHVEVLSPQGPALGLLPPVSEPRFDTFTFSLEPGMSLMLYTDGITEALEHGDDDEEFGTDRLIAVWNEQEESDPIKSGNAILEAVDSFTSGAEPSDDRTLLILHRPNGKNDAAHD